MSNSVLTDRAPAVPAPRAHSGGGPRPASEDEAIRSGRPPQVAITVLAVLPVLSFVFVQAGAQVYLSEVVMMGCWPALAALEMDAAVRRQVRLILGLLGLWALGSIIAALVVWAPISATLKEVGAIVCLASDTAVFAYALGACGKFRAQYLRFAVAGIGAAAMIEGLFRIDPVARVDPFKFDESWGLALLVVVLADVLAKSAGRFVCASVIALLAAFEFLQDCRCIGGLLLLTAFLVVGRRGAANARPPRPVRGLAMVAAVAFAVIPLYTTAVNGGWLGQSAQYRYNAIVGDDHSAVGVLIDGRREIPFFVQGLEHHGLLGMGPKPTLTPGEYRSAVDFYARRGVILNGGDLSYFADGRLPLHSFAFGAWATSGVLALPFWIAVLRRFSVATLGVFRHSYVQTFLGVFLLWNLFFSPLGSSTRLTLALTVAMLLTHRATAQSTESPGPVQA
jgi:hypothetical protein